MIAINRPGFLAIAAISPAVARITICYTRGAHISRSRANIQPVYAVYVPYLYHPVHGEHSV